MTPLRERNPNRVSTKAISEFRILSETWDNFPSTLTEDVIEDFVERENVGVESYGGPLQINNGRDALVDAYEELLDAFMYLTQRGVEEQWENYNIDLALSKTGSAIREVVYALNNDRGVGFLGGRDPQPDPIEPDNRNQLAFYDDDYYVAVTDGE